MHKPLLGAAGTLLRNLEPEVSVVGGLADPLRSPDGVWSSFTDAVTQILLT